MFTSDASFVMAGSREAEAPVKLRHNSTSFRAKCNFLFSFFDANRPKHAVFVGNLFDELAASLGVLGD